MLLSKIAIAELNPAQQFSDHLENSLFHLNIAQKQGEMHRAKHWIITLVDHHHANVQRVFSNYFTSFLYLICLPQPLHTQQSP